MLSLGHAYKILPTHSLYILACVSQPPPLLSRFLPSVPIICIFSSKTPQTKGFSPQISGSRGKYIHSATYYCVSQPPPLLSRFLPSVPIKICIFSSKNPSDQKGLARRSPGPEESISIQPQNISPPYRRDYWRHRSPWAQVATCIDAVVFGINNQIPVTSL